MVQLLARRLHDADQALERLWVLAHQQRLQARVHRRLAKDGERVELADEGTEGVNQFDEIMLFDVLLATKELDENRFLAICVRL